MKTTEMELHAEVLINMKLRENETKEEAEDRFYNTLYNGICDFNDDFDFMIFDQKVREREI